MPLTNFTSSIDIAIRALIYTKFNAILGLSNMNTQTAICPKGIAQRMIAEKSGKSVFPFINIFRSDIEFNWKRNQTSLARRGMSVSAGTNVKAIPVETNYDFWIWSDSLDKINECIESYMFWRHKTPQVFIDYGEVLTNIPFDLRFARVADESPVEELFTKGQIFCYRFPILLDSWIFDSETAYVINKIRLSFFDKDNLADNECIAVAVEDSNQDTEAAEALKLFREHYYRISSIDAGTKTFYLPDDNRVGDFSEGQTIYVSDSTSTDGVYTIDNVSYDSTIGTAIVVNETIQNSTEAGCLYFTENF